jgi:activator of HSP90 ATPase
MTNRDESSAGSQAPTRRDVIVGVSMGIGSFALRSRNAVAATAPNEISRSAESIHQEVMLKAEPARVYGALMDAKEFQQVVLLSAAVKSGMVQTTVPAEISRAAGGAFRLFGGHISGRHIELIPNERIVQAWRAGDWAIGTYSIARFELAKDGTGTRLMFDHTGFPVGQAEHLADGWKGNYWEPLEKFLATTGL